MPKSPAGYLHLAGACCVGQATEILCSLALQGKQLLQAVWSCLYTGLPWKSPCLTALHTHMSRVYFSGTWFVSPLPSRLAGDWQEILGWGSSVDVGCKLIYVYGEGLFSTAWILSRRKQKQVEQWDTCWVSKNIFPRVILGKSMKQVANPATTSIRVTVFLGGFRETVTAFATFLVKSGFLNPWAISPTNKEVDFLLLLSSIVFYFTCCIKKISHSWRLVINHLLQTHHRQTHSRSWHSWMQRYSWRSSYPGSRSPA